VLILARDCREPLLEGLTAGPAGAGEPLALAQAEQQAWKAIRRADGRPRITEVGDAPLARSGQALAPNGSRQGKR